ncbi:MAG TPA: MOSC domain-containing protein [Acidimicrobiales bacterium]|nr:MOSC domain-containing protein [Acidimicrobiales bacterium]
MTTRPPLSATVTAVYVGQPRHIGTTRRGPVESAIAKSLVDRPALALGTTNLAGDRQADLRVHGGPDKAVYVYPTEHYPTWRAEGFAVEVGGLGENVALAGVTERDVLLGDVWRWGDARLQVSQPRSPCYKLALHAGRKDIGPRMIETGRTGWYLRVLETGTVPTGGEFVLDHRDDGAPSVHDLFSAMFAADGEADDDVVDRVLRSPALADAWRRPLAARRGDARTSGRRPDGGRSDAARTDGDRTGGGRTDADRSDGARSGGGR